MGQSRKRIGADGKPRYTAYYNDARGQRQSAGTFSTKKAADQAWQHAEALQLTGQPGDARAGRVNFADYVRLQWLPNHIVEPTTMQSYRYNLERHIIPWFGPMRMATILPIHVRKWVIDLIGQGVSPATIRHQKIILSAVFTTALNDFVIRLHPCRGVKTPTVPVKEYRILTPAELGQLLLALPNDPARLIIDTAIGSGLRWGELAELRLGDLRKSSGILTVSRTVVELNPSEHPDGGRFLVKAYPKSKHSRRFQLDPALVTAIFSHAAQHDIGTQDLLFPLHTLTTGPHQRAGQSLANGDDLGLTDPNPSGRRYRHGTMSAYTAGACRCRRCRSAFAAYRADRRDAGLDQPRGERPPPDTDGHIPRGWWRNQIWYPACAAAKLHPRPRMHDLRHSHASWLLAGGADIENVRARLGHESIVTTGKYVHTLATADKTALDALNRIRYPKPED